ncbi:MAG: prepilin-type N-terminal cleavage/methylation domain-containing protein [Deltaproteobacteria bacterium]|nr:prepilin-type N-terminal cleavage/methylation domain-containing protein [Deltaproteobacteria bacterium]
MMTRQCEKGFTLIEVLISVAILSGLVFALYSTFFISRKAVSAVDDSLIRLQEARRALDGLKREIEASYFSPDRPYTVFKIEDRDIYGSSASRMTFTSFSDITPGLARAGYFAEEAGGRVSLKKTLSSAYSSKDTAELELMEDIESFTVEARYGDGWIKSWDGAEHKGAPEEVRLTVVFQVWGGKSKVTLSDVAFPKAGRPAL